jgi:hypothetical protein
MQKADQGKCPDPLFLVDVDPLQSFDLVRGRVFSQDRFNVLATVEDADDGDLFLINSKGDHCPLFVVRQA